MVLGDGGWVMTLGQVEGCLQTWHVAAFPSFVSLCVSVIFLPTCPPEIYPSVSSSLCASFSWRLYYLSISDLYLYVLYVLYRSPVHS